MAKKHGHRGNGDRTRSPTYNSWRCMKARCLNPKNDKYPWYGGQGVKVHESWLKFENFLKDMGERPAGKTLDRIDAKGDYSPDNCRWATAKTQARNKR